MGVDGRKKIMSKKKKLIKFVEGDADNGHEYSLIVNSSELLPDAVICILECKPMHIRLALKKIPKDRVVLLDTSVIGKPDLYWEKPFKEAGIVVDKEKTIAIRSLADDWDYLWVIERT